MHLEIAADHLELLERYFTLGKEAGGAIRDGERSADGVALLNLLERRFPIDDGVSGAGSRNALEVELVRRLCMRGARACVQVPAGAWKGCVATAAPGWKRCGRAASALTLPLCCICLAIVLLLGVLIAAASVTLTRACLFKP